MPEPLDIHSLWLRIDSENSVTLDIQVGEQWRRVIRTCHAGLTSEYLSRGWLEVGSGVIDVTAEYQELEDNAE